MGVLAISRWSLPAGRVRLTAICVSSAARPWAGSAATAFLLVIPENHAAFGRDYTLEPHDRVLAGTGPEVSYTQWLDFTPAKVPGLAVVQYVDCKTAAGQAAHVEAGGWWTRSGSGAHSLSN